MWLVLSQSRCERVAVMVISKSMVVIEPATFLRSIVQNIIAMLPEIIKLGARIDN